MQQARLKLQPNGWCIHEYFGASQAEKDMEKKEEKQKAYTEQEEKQNGGSWR